ncbi:hypothetical protein ES703_97187 [subsurface metagenome]
MLWHNKTGAPADGEKSVESGIGFLQLKNYRVVIRLVDLVNENFKIRTIGQHTWMSHTSLNGVNKVVRRKFHAITPVDSPSEFSGHLGKVLVVNRLRGRQRVIPRSAYTRIRVYVPQRVEGKLL